MIAVTELRAGAAFKMGGQPYRVLEYKHTKMGRGTASIRVKVRDLKSGSILEKTFISGAKVEPVELEIKMLQYLYRDDHNCFLMDPQAFDQIAIPLKVFGEKIKYLKEEGKVKVVFYEGEGIDVEFPTAMIYQVASTPPGVKGDSASGATKPATLENGLVVQVPLFINQGDKIKVDTRSGAYVERVR